MQYTGCSFQSVYFEVWAKIVNFHPILTKYGSFESQGLGIYEFTKTVGKVVKLTKKWRLSENVDFQLRD